MSLISYNAVLNCLWYTLYEAVDYLLNSRHAEDKVLL